MPATRRKPSGGSAKRSVQYRKPIGIKLSHACDPSEENVDLETDLDVASQESYDESASGVSTGYMSGAANAVETPAPEPIVISGILLRPTVAFDTFWRFAAERKAIDDRRRAGEPKP